MFFVCSYSFCFFYLIALAVTEEEYDRLMNTNAKAVFFLSQEVGKVIQEDGAIVNISSGITQGSYPGYSVYTATKAVVSQLSKAFALELAPKRVTVLTVSPGATETGMWKRVRRERGREGQREEQNLQLNTSFYFLPDMLPDDIRTMATARSPLQRTGKHTNKDKITIIT